MFTAPIQHGNSGGPIFNGEGHVIGIVSAYSPHINIIGRVPYNVAQNLNLAVSIGAIRGFLKSQSSLPQNDFFENETGEIQSSSSQTVSKISEAARPYVVRLECQSPLSDQVKDMRERWVKWVQKENE